MGWFKSDWEADLEGMHGCSLPPTYAGAGPFKALNTNSATLFCNAQGAGVKLPTLEECDLSSLSQSVI